MRELTYEEMQSISGGKVYCRECYVKLGEKVWFNNNFGLAIHMILCH